MFTCVTFSVIKRSCFIFNVFCLNCVPVGSDISAFMWTQKSTSRKENPPLASFLTIFTISLTTFFILFFCFLLFHAPDSLSVGEICFITSSAVAFGALKGRCYLSCRQRDMHLSPSITSLYSRRSVLANNLSSRSLTDQSLWGFSLHVTLMRKHRRLWMNTFGHSFFYFVSLLVDRSAS